MVTVRLEERLLQSRNRKTKCLYVSRSLPPFEMSLSCDEEAAVHCDGHDDGST